MSAETAKTSAHEIHKDSRIEQQDISNMHPQKPNRRFFHLQNFWQAGKWDTQLRIRQKLARLTVSRAMERVCTKAQTLVGLG
jgi:hypothetical protein